MSAMLAIQSDTTASITCTPNIVPCKIYHTGATRITKRYWSPSKETDGSHTTYFRGRKLRGRAAKLPTHYQGSILKATARTLPQTKSQAPVLAYDDEEDDLDQDEQEDTPEPVKILEKISTFDEVLVWGHDQLPASDDPFVRNIEEWIGFAEAIHGNSKVLSPKMEEQVATDAVVR